MRLVIAVLMISASQSAACGELAWFETKAVDANKQGSDVVLFYGKIDTDDIKSVTLGTAPPAFVHIRSLMWIDQNAEIKRLEDVSWNGKRYSSGEIYIKTENIITIHPLNETLISDIEKVVAGSSRADKK